LWRRPTLKLVHLAELCVLCAACTPFKYRAELLWLTN
jgi:hypothetical protein